MHWRQMSEAPTDGTRILLLDTSGKIMCGGWNQDKYAKRPRPYWTDDLERTFGILYTRNRTRVAWMPLPAPPAEEVEL